MTHLYYEEYRQTLQEVPELVILDTREKVQPILKLITQLPGIEWDETDVIQTVMQAIQYEGTALADLHSKCLRICHGVTGMPALQPAELAQRGRLVALDPTGYEVWREAAAPVPREQLSEPVWNNLTTQLANLLSELGMYLYAQLRSIGCYSRGYLFYQFKDWIGYDMVLVRFQLDVETLR